MESIQSIKRRIRAVQNTAQITKAMEMVSANKMRRSQEIALASRPYALKTLELLRELSSRVPEAPALMRRREGKTLVLVVSADKGLAGSLNSNVFRRFEKELGKNPPQEEYSFAAVGKKADEYLARKGLAPVRSFLNFGDYIETDETKPLADFLVQGFAAGTWGRILTISTHFRTTLRQDVVMRELLPATFESIEKTIREIVPEYGKYSGETREGAERGDFEYLIEPSPEAILDELVRHLVDIVVYNVILEANASEHSARMVAMKNASDNARDVKGELSLLYNKSRQAGITREISEITAGAETLKQ